MKPRATWGGLVLLWLALAACASPHAAFLKTAVNHDAQETVADILGPPHAVWELTDGETLWRYRHTERLWAYQGHSGMSGSPGGITVEGPGLVVLPGGHCTEYLLRFDRAKVLRAWSRQPCREWEKLPAKSSRASPPSYDDERPG